MFISLSHKLHPEGSDHGILGVPGSPDSLPHPPQGVAFFLLVPAGYTHFQAARRTTGQKRDRKCSHGPPLLNTPLTSTYSRGQGAAKRPEGDLILGSRVPRLKCCCRGRIKSGLSGPQPSSPQLCLGEGPASCFSLFHMQDGPHLCQDGEDAHLQLLLGVGQADGCVS